MEEDVEDIIKEDEEVNVFQDQGQEYGVVDTEQWHTLEDTTGDNASGDNGQLEDRCSDGHQMRSSDDDQARGNVEKICADDFHERCSGYDQENCSNDNAKGDSEEEPKRYNDGRVVPTEKGREFSSTMEELDVKKGLAENEESEEHIVFGGNQTKCCTISSHIKGVNQETREEEDHNVTLSTTEKHKLLRLKADKMYQRNAERMQLKYSKAKRKKIRTFSVGNFVSVKIPRIDRTSTDLHRVPCIVVEVLGKEYHLYRLRYV